jgi:hypothetical protein
MTIAAPMKIKKIPDTFEAVPKTGRWMWCAASALPGRSPWRAEIERTDH